MRRRLASARRTARGGAAQRQHQEAQQPRHRTVGKVRENLVEARLDGGEAAVHAPLDQRQVGVLAAFVLPALEHGGQQIELGQDVAEARRDHLLALEIAAERQQRHIDRKREGRRVTAELAVEMAWSRRRRAPARTVRRSSCGPRRGTHWRWRGRHAPRRRGRTRRARAPDRSSSSASISLRM